MSNPELIDPPAPANAMPPVVYEPNEAAIAKVREQFADLIADPDICKTPEGYERVKNALRVIVPMRTAIEKARVTLKAGALEYGRKVDLKAKQLTNLVLNIEDPLRQRKEAIDAAAELAARKLVEEQMAKEKAEAEAKEKAEAEAKEAARRAAERAEREREAAEREAERAKLAAERAEWERQRAAQAEADRLERARIAAEQEEIRRKAMEYEEKIRAEREQREKELAELRAERQAAEQREREAREAEERKRFEEETRVRLEREAKERAERERIDAERRAKEQAEREAAERKAEEEARPDAQKIKAFGDALAAFADESKLTVKTPKAVGFVTLIDAAIADVILKCRSYKTR